MSELQERSSINKQSPPGSPGRLQERVRPRRSASNSPAANQRKAELQERSSINKQSAPESPGRLKERVRPRRSASNSPAANQRKASLRSPGAGTPSRSPGSLSGKKTSIREILRSRPIATARPSRNASAPQGASSTHGGPRKSRPSAVSPTPPPRPPLETSPLTSSGRKKISHSLNSPHSPRRMTSSRAGRSSASSPINTRVGMDSASQSPKRRTRKGHVRHNSLGALHNHIPPAPSMTGSPKRGSPEMPKASSSSNLRHQPSIRRSKAPPPPQSALQRISMKISNRSELKAEKKARAEKLMQ